MPYVLNTPEDQQAMLAAIGLDAVEQLFDAIPESLRLQQLLDLPPALSELELEQHLCQLAARNQHGGQRVCFLGGGSYDHFVPAVVDALAGRAEFYTSYTPYQPEVSQGNLQAMFEYQTLICQLTGMDVSNASLYDGATAAAEGVLMCISATGRDQKVVVAAGVHPEYRQVLQTYLANTGTDVITIPVADGRLDLEQLEAAVDNQTACVLVQHPNFFGCLEDMARVVAAAHQQGAMVVQVFDPISLGLLKRPGQLGVDVAVAEGQGLGNPMSCGGPYLGIMACRQDFVRRMPGRIVGQTVDRRDRRCWVLTLQTREQHIRREKATSNICTNQGLMALRAAIYLALMGPQGMREVAQLCLEKAHYAAQRIAASPPLQLAFQAPFFKEFAVRVPGGPMEQLLDGAAAAGLFAGVPLARWYPELDDCLLIAVTEKRTRNEIDRLADCLARSVSSSQTIHA